MPAPEKNKFAAKDEADKSSSFLYIRAKKQDKAAWVRAAQRSGNGLSSWASRVLNVAAAAPKNQLAPDDA